MQQTVHSCTARDGVRIAYSSVGSGYPVVLSPGWISHLELDWATPFYRAFWEPIAEQYRLIRYDRRGTGLSQRKVKDYSLQAQTGDLAAVIDAIGEEQIALFGHCTGGPVTLNYVAAHQEKVSHLVLYGTYASGHYLELSNLADALRRAIDADWGGVGSIAMADMFFPGATTEQRELYAYYQQQCATKDGARGQSGTISSHSAKHLLKDIQTPALILHKREDKIVPFELGRRLAGELPNSRLVPLEGDSNVIGIGSPKVTKETIEAVLGFLEAAGSAPSQASVSLDGMITKRERDVLRLVACGKSNREIAEDLRISINTADRHVSNILTKIGASNRAEAASHAVRAGLA